MSLTPRYSASSLLCIVVCCLFVFGDNLASADCGSCHQTIQPPESHTQVPCVDCHGGTLAPQKKKAHFKLILQPTGLGTPGVSCAKSGCHLIESKRVSHSLMATAPGILALTTLAFETDDSTTAAKHLSQSQTKDYLSKRCDSCHLDKPLTNADSPTSRRGGGCLACHSGPKEPTGHRRIDKKVSDDRCFGCHSRSGRVSLNYGGIAEMSKGQAAALGVEVSRLPDGRPVRLMPSDIHFKAGMGCTDCHTYRGLMGGKKPVKQKGDQQDIQCADCHRAQTQTPTATQRFGTFMPRLKQGQSRSRTLELKFQKKTLLVRQIDKQHAGYGHDRLSCDACHSQWVPQCFGCHISYQDDGKQYDHNKQQLTPGRWEEQGWAFEVGLPALGVSEGEVVPFVPGMIASLKLPGQPVKHWNIYAPTSPHTTGKSRSCASCHLSDKVFAIYQEKAVNLKGTEQTSNKTWTGNTLRPTSRAFNPVEVRRIKRVGLCLDCHAVDGLFYQNYRSKLKQFDQTTGKIRGHSGSE